MNNKYYSKLVNISKPLKAVCKAQKLIEFENPQDSLKGQQFEQKLLKPQ